MIKEDRDIIDASPVTRVKPVAKERSRERFLSDDEIRWFWAACAETPYPFGPYFQTLLLTDAEISGDVWHLDPARTKNKRPHDVPLSSAAMDVLDGLIRINSDAGYVFTTTGRSPVSGFKGARCKIAQRMESLATEERGEPVDIPHWTPHDLRRTTATTMARLGFPIQVTEAVMNHVSGARGGIVGVYQRHDYAEEKRQALEAWGRFVLSLVEGSANNVVPLEAGR